MTEPDGAGVEVVLVGPLDVDYTAASAPQLAGRTLTDLIGGGLPPSPPTWARVIDEVSMTRVLAALRGPGLHAEPGGRSVRIAQWLAGEPCRLRVGMVGVAGQSLLPDLTIVGDLDRHGIDRTHVVASGGLSGITLSVGGPDLVRLVYGGANQDLGGMLRENRSAIAAYTAQARLFHVVAPVDASAVDAVGQLLVAVRQANPAVRVSIDTSLCREANPEQLAGLLTLADLAVVPEQDLVDLATPADVHDGRAIADAVVSRLRRRQPGLVLAQLDPTGTTLRCPCHTARTLPINTPAGSPNSEAAVSVVLAHLIAAGRSCDERIAALQAGTDALAGHDDNQTGQPGDINAAAPPAARVRRWWPPSQWIRR